MRVVDLLILRIPILSVSELENLEIIDLKILSRFSNSEIEIFGLVRIRRFFSLIKTSRKYQIKKRPSSTDVLESTDS